VKIKYQSVVPELLLTWPATIKYAKCRVEFSYFLPPKIHDLVLKYKYIYFILFFSALLFTWSYSCQSNVWLHSTEHSVVPGTVSSQNW